TGVRSLTAREVAKRFRYIDLGVIEYCRVAVRCGQMKTFGKTIDGNDPFRTEHVGAFDRELPHGTAAPDRNRVSGLYLAVFGGHISRREDVREKQYLLVGQRTGNFQRTHICEGHADQLRRAPAGAAVPMR